MPHNPFTDDFFTRKPGKKLILSGAAAVARAAFEAQAGLILTYPGSPVVETFDILSSPKSPMSNCSEIVINEHVAFHKALGFSMTGGRSMLIMKHVGLNVSADPAHYSGYLGVKGGLVIILGADAGAKCSTGEFDCRFYSLHTHLPILEPADFEDAKTLTFRAFELSERLELPIVVCLPSSLCYGMGIVTAQKPEQPRKPENIPFHKSRAYTNVGPNAVKSHARLLDKIRSLGENELMPDQTRLKGYLGIAGAADNLCDTLIVTSGIYRDFVMEALDTLGIGAWCFAPFFTYPLSSFYFNQALLQSRCSHILFVEDLEGFLEIQACRIIAKQSVKGFTVRGKEFFQASDYLGIDSVISGLRTYFSAHEPLMLSGPLNKSSQPGPAAGPKPVLNPVMREGTFCPGCPHRAFFYALNSILGSQDIMGGDIGCSSLPPHFSDWLTCMNSGTSIAAGVSLAHEKAGSSVKTVSLMGDSTFFHSGMQTVMDAVIKDSDQTCFILDNSWTAMTGHQMTPSTKKDLAGRKVLNALDIPGLLRAMGVKKISKADPYDLFAMKRTIIKHLGIKGFTCVVVEHECALVQAKRAGQTEQTKIKKSAISWKSTYYTIPENCQKCGICYSVLNCPAIYKNSEQKAVIDQNICVGCGMCYKICPNSAIVKFEMLE